MRWDRTGTLVSPAYNYKQNPERLLRFIYLIATSTREDQGYEPAFRSRKRTRNPPELRDLNVSLQKPGEDNKWYRKLAEGLGVNVRTSTLNPLHEVTLCWHLA